MFYFLYNNTTGQILATNTTGFTPGTGEAVLGPLSSADTTAVVAYQYPQRYLVQGSPAALVEQPWWSVQVAATSTANQYAITATLENPPSTPPATATLMVPGASISGILSSNQVTWTVAVHPSILSQVIPVQVSANGTVPGTTQFGGTETHVALTCLATASPPTIVPTGPTGRHQVIRYHLGIHHDPDMWYAVLVAIASQLPSALQTTLTNLSAELASLGL